MISGSSISAIAASMTSPQVVRRDVRRHADRDARAEPFTSRFGKRAGRTDRHHLALVVVRLEVDDVLVEVAQHLDRDRREPALGVAHGRGAVAVDVAEVALAVDERVARRERLRQPHERVVDRRSRRAGGSRPCTRRRPWRTSRTGGSAAGRAAASRRARGDARASARRARRAARARRSRSSRSPCTTSASPPRARGTRCAPSPMSIDGQRWRSLLRYRAAGSRVEELDVAGVLLDEVAARLDLVAHQHA